MKKDIYLDIQDLCIGVHTQNRYPPRYHSNRPGSSEDTLENSSVRSSPEMDSLIKGKYIFLCVLQLIFCRKIRDENFPGITDYIYLKSSTMLPAFNPPKKISRVPMKPKIYKTIILLKFPYVSIIYLDSFDMLNKCFIT